METLISEITIGKRHRKDLGDVPALAASIEAIGLLHPVVLRPDKTLIVGGRRIAAYKHLGRDKIPANIARNLTELADLLRAEQDENTCRKDFLPSEAAAMFKDTLPIAEDLAKAEQAAGQKTGASKGGKTAGRGRPIASRETFPKGKQDESKRAAAIASKPTGKSHKTNTKALAVMEQGTPELAAEMDKTGKVDRAYRKLKAEQEDAKVREAAKAAPKTDLWTLTEEQAVVACQALITDPPYGILDEPWEPRKLEEFTREWARRWEPCGADFIAVFWSQRHLWGGREWFDDCFAGYHFRQLLVWHYPNNKSPQSREGFKQTWEPIFFYRRNNSTKQITLGGGTWGDGLTDFDCHVAAVPQSNFTEADRKIHPAQKPVSVMAWLINALTLPGEVVADPFCGSGTTGIAALQLGRRFHGIETDPEFLKSAKGRIARYGKFV